MELDEKVMNALKKIDDLSIEKQYVSIMPKARDLSTLISQSLTKVNEQLDMSLVYLVVDNNTLDVGFQILPLEKYPIDILPYVKDQPFMNMKTFVELYLIEDNLSSYEISIKAPERHLDESTLIEITIA